MWRETDSWFEIQFADGSSGFVHLDLNGDCLGVFMADGTDVSTNDHLEYTCLNDNAAPPAWYKA